MIFHDFPLQISILGLGHVGSALAQLLLGYQDAALDLNLVDPSSDVDGTCLDLFHSCAALGYHKIRRNDPGRLARSHFIFHTAGANSKPGSSRHSVAAENRQLTRQIFSQLDLREDARVIVITNPVDVMAMETWKSTGLPAAQVVGTGTLLDSHRLAWYMHELSNLPLSQVRAMVLGEHSRTMVPVFSQSWLGENSALQLSDKSREELRLKTIGTATRIRQTAPATKWAVAACAFNLMKSFLNPPRQDLVASVWTPPSIAQQLEVDELFLGLPIEFDAQGCRATQLPSLQVAEMNALKESAKVLAALNQQLGL